MKKTAPLPPNEEERLRLLRHMERLDVEPGHFFDAVSHIVALIFDVPVTQISLVDDLPWRTETDVSDLCAHTPQQDTLMVVPDILEDPRFAGSALTNHDPPIRFFASHPLQLAPKVRAGALCLMDYQPRALDSRQVVMLELLAGHIASLIRLHLEKLEANREFGTLVMVKQKLQFQKDLMEAILDSEPESVQVLSAAGELEQINRAGLEMLEAASLTEARQRKLAEYVLPEFRERFGALQDKVFQGEHASAEYRIRGIKGAERWMESHAAPLYDHQGKVNKLIAITRDITKLKESQQQLALAARVFGEAQEGIIITDAKSVIVDVNPAFCTVTGYRREEAIGQTPRILQSGLQGPDFYAALWKTLLETGRWKGEIWSRKKNGELYAELISINALRDEAGNAINYVALFLDITEIKRQQGAMPEAK